MKKYTYVIKYLSCEAAPDGTANYSIVGSDECKVKDMERRLDKYLASNKLSRKGNRKEGTVLNRAGKAIARYDLLGKLSA